MSILKTLVILGCMYISMRTHSCTMSLFISILKTSDSQVSFIVKYVVLIILQACYLKGLKKKSFSFSKNQKFGIMEYIAI